jgi:hypothetical protein
MKLIYQKHETSCTSAALATVANVSYEKALRLIHPGKSRHGKAKGAFHTHIIRALEKLNIPYKITYKKFNKIKNPCILIVTVEKPLSKSEFGLSKSGFVYPMKLSHAIVWTGKKIFDPYSNRPEYKSFTAHRALNRVFLNIEILSKYQ